MITRWQWIDICESCLAIIEGHRPMVMTSFTTCAVCETSGTKCQKTPIKVPVKQLRGMVLEVYSD